MSADARSNFEAAFRASLDRLEAAGRPVAFWWRDDDAVEPGEALDRLLDLAARARVPLLLAVVPEPAQPGLFARIRRERSVTVSQHGFAHANHETPPVKSAELGSGRPAEAVLGELAAGRRKLELAAGAQFAPILTPPWNRIAPEVAGRRCEVGLKGLSTFGRAADDRRHVNTHLDVIAWRRDRSFMGWEKAIAVIEEELEARRKGVREPLGLLTHHLVHDAAVWEFLESFLAVATTHPAVHWPELRTLFGLDEDS